MKKFRYIFLSLALAAAACSEGALDPHSVIADPVGPQTDFERWAADNFTTPYNIAIKYKLEDLESPLNYYLAPAYPERCAELSRALKYIWLETFTEMMGVDFLREHSPKLILMVGSYALNSDGSYVLGTAESGMKVTLMGVNQFNAADLKSTDANIKAAAMAQLTTYMKTVFHEFAHILHQKKAYDPEFEKISSEDYLEDMWNWSTNDDATAYQKGFVSRYARKNRNEDFVELFAYYVTMGPEYIESIKTYGGADATDKINRKFTILNGYLRDTWHMNIAELHRIFEKRLTTVDMIEF